MAVGVEFWGLVVLVGTWSAGVALVPDSVDVQPKPMFGTAGGDARSSWWKSTWYRTKKASMDATVFLNTLYVGFGVVQNLSLSLDGGDRKVFLQNL